MEEEEKKQNILDNPKYMNNLVTKIKDIGFVLENQEEKYNTYKDLSLLYELVDTYAKNNNLYSINQSYHSIYYVKYNNYIFSIFKKNNDKKVLCGCYVNYLNENQLPYCIDFDNIKNNEKIDINSFSRGMITQLKEIIDKLYQEGFPLYFIQQLVDNMIEEKSESEERSIYQKKY